MPVHLEIKKEDSKDCLVKSNALVEARYRLSIQELRIMHWLISLINQDDEDFKPYRLGIREFAAIVKINPDGQYQKIKKITEKLTLRPLKIFDKYKQTFLQTTWISAAFYELKKGYVSLEFSPHLKPYLLQLKREFTKFDPNELLHFKSFYSIRIFELLKQYESIGKRKISIDELREYCGVNPNEYRDYTAIKINIMDRATAEINAKTNYRVYYTEIKESRKIVAIEWTIKKETHFEKDQTEKTSIVEKELRSANALTEGIMEFGFSRVAAKRFLQRDSEETVRNALKSVNLQIERGHVKNAKAMFVVAVNEKWNPEIFVAKKPKKAKE